MMNIMRAENGPLQARNNVELELARAARALADMLAFKTSKAELIAEGVVLEATKALQAAELLSLNSTDKGTKVGVTHALLTEANRKAAVAENEAVVAKKAAGDLSSQAAAAEIAATKILEATHEAGSERVSQMHRKGQTSELVRLAQVCNEAAEVVSAIASKFAVLEARIDSAAAELENATYATASIKAQHCLLMSAEAEARASKMATALEEAKKSSHIAKNTASKQKHAADAMKQVLKISVTKVLTAAQVAKATQEALNATAAYQKADVASGLASQQASSAKHEAEIASRSADDAASQASSAQTQLQIMQKAHINAEKQREDDDAGLAKAFSDMAHATNLAQQFSDKLRKMARTQPPFIFCLNMTMLWQQENQTQIKAPAQDQLDSRPSGVRNSYESSFCSRDGSVASTSSPTVTATPTAHLQSLQKKLLSSAGHREEMISAPGRSCCCWWWRSPQIYPT